MQTPVELDSIEEELQSQIKKNEQVIANVEKALKNVRELLQITVKPTGQFNIILSTLLYSNLV